MDRRILWAGAAALSAAASFAAGVAYGIPLVSIDSQYDLERLTYQMLFEMRESGTYLTQDNYMILMAANRADEAIIMFPNAVRDGPSAGRGWSPDSETLTVDYPNGTRLYKMTGPDGRVLREIALHDQRDRMLIAVITDHRGAYLSDSEREMISREFFPESTGRDGGPPEGAGGRGGPYGDIYEVAALVAKRDDLAGAGNRTAEQERFYRWAFEEYSVPDDAESIDRRLAEIAGGAGPGHAQRLADRVNSGVDAGFVPEGLDMVDGEFWSRVRLSAHCDAAPGCEVDVGEMVDRPRP